MDKIIKKTIYLFLFVLLLLTLCYPVSATADYTGTLTADLSNPTLLHSGVGAAGTLSYSGTNYSTMLWTTNFNTVGSPDILIWYGLVDSGLIGTTTFVINDTAGVYASGTLECLNGTSMYGSAKQYMYFHFTSWTPGTRTGEIVGTLTIPSVTAIPKFLGTDAGFLQRFDSVQVNPTIPLGGYHSAGTWEGGKGGSLYIMNPYVVAYNYEITGYGGSGISRVSEVNLSRPANNLGSIVGAYNATTGSVLYVSEHTSSTLSEDFLVVGSNYILSAYVPLMSTYYNSSPFYTDGAIPTPTPIGGTGGYTFTVTPDTVNYNQNFTASLSSSTSVFTGINEVKFGWTQSSSQDILYDRDEHPLIYKLISSTWYQYDGAGFTINKGTTFPSSITLIPANFGSGDFLIDCYLEKTDGSVIYLNDTLTITTTNQQELTIRAIDFNDGYLVSTAHINVLDIASNIWNNKTSGGEKIFYYPYGKPLYIDINSTYYYTSTKNYTVTSAPYNTVEVIMTRGITTPATNVTLRVNVMDNLGGYLNNAKVSVLNDESYFDSESKYTNYAGIATFTVLPSTDYAISVSKSGYLSTGKIVNSGTGGLTLDTTVVLNIGTNPTATPTPLPTTAPGQYIGNIGGTNLTPVTCQVVLPKGATLLDTLRNNMACAGIQSGQNQGFGIALLIIFTLGIIGGKYGKGMGVVMGMCSGYVLSLAMNLVPLWTFVAMIIFICLILAIKLWSSDK